MYSGFAHKALSLVPICCLLQSVLRNVFLPVGCGSEQEDVLAYEGAEPSVSFLAFRHAVAFFSFNNRPIDMLPYEHLELLGRQLSSFILVGVHYGEYEIFELRSGVFLYSLSKLGEFNLWTQSDGRLFVCVVDGPFSVVLDAVLGHLHMVHLDALHAAARVDNQLLYLDGFF